MDAPGIKLSQQELNQVRHNVALGHGLAVQAVRAHGRVGTKVGPAENIVSCIPAIETPANIRAAEIATRELNADYLTVMLEGKYTNAFLTFAGKDAPKYTTEDLSIISSPIDFVGLNVYTPTHYVVAADNKRGLHSAVSRFVPTHGLDLAQDRSRGDVLGAAPRGKDLGRKVDLHYRERNLGDR